MSSESLSLPEGICALGVLVRPAHHMQCGGYDSQELAADEKEQCENDTKFNPKHLVNPPIQCLQSCPTNFLLLKVLLAISIIKASLPLRGAEH